MIGHPSDLYFFAFSQIGTYSKSRNTIKKYIKDLIQEGERHENCGRHP
jgi:hypothetical protein